MLSPRMQDALNAQINAELHAFYTYLSMSAYFESQGYPGFAAWMRHHSDEEMVHAMKIYDYIIDRRSVVKLQAIAAPRIEWSAALDVLKDALAHEQHVTKLINDLVALALVRETLRPQRAELILDYAGLDRIIRAEC